MSRDFQEAGWANDAWQKPQAGKTVVMFRLVPTKNEFKSTEAGRPIYEDKLHIVKIPADQFLKIDRPIKEAEARREYPAEWAAWERSQETKPLGISIDFAHFLTESQKLEFKAMQILTIEQLAELPDSYQGIMGMRTYRQKAQVFLASGKDAELVSKIKAEAASEINALKAQMEELRAMLEEATKPKGKA